MEIGERRALGQMLCEATEYHERGRLDEAEHLYRKLLEQDSEHFDALNRLAIVALQRADLEEALRRIHLALRVSPNSPSATSNKGTILLSLKKYDEALATYQHLIDLNADDADAHFNCGFALMELERPAEALSNYDRAIALRPRDIEAHWHRGNALLKLKHPEEALASYDKALEINPHSAEALTNRGSALCEFKRFEEALASYDKALAINPRSAEALYNRGNVLFDLKRSEEALTSYDKALAIKPDHSKALTSRGVLLGYQGRMQEGLSNLRRALAQKPDKLRFACAFKLLLPPIAASDIYIKTWRERYRRGIGALMTSKDKLDDQSLRDVHPNSFYLAYHNLADRPLMEALCRLFRAKAPTVTFTAPHTLDWQPPTNARRIRIGICSSFLRSSHTIGKLYLGLICHLDRSRFSVTVIHNHDAERDPSRVQLDQCADKVLELSNYLTDQQNMLAAEQLDVLFYPDIGMGRASYFLAYARLAPVQIVSWGHPDTTGIDTLDYFISSDLIEPDGAAHQYSEQLVCLSRLPCFRAPPTIPAQIPGRSAFGLPAAGILYGCPQTLFKFHPQFDAVLEEIACGDPDGHIVVLEGTTPHWVELLRQRWAGSHSILLERVTFLPPQPPDRFMALLTHFDILLDPIHFGSGNTLYEAMALGTPVVTWPGAFMRGRIVAGAYRQIALQDPPIAKRLEDYAPLAVGLGRTPERRLALRQATTDRARQGLFDDWTAVQEFEWFLEQAIAAAGRRQKLPVGWRADLPVARTEQRRDGFRSPGFGRRQ